ncbi:MAG: outer membrane protein assembly factor BamB [Gammaproteobacteria bacterium]|nr:outer membrane protein assembly factor BamB [Gammaproteobacteria bacterium]
MTRTLCLAAAVLALIACSRDKKADPPAPLVDFVPTVRVDRLWQSSVDGENPLLRLGLGLGQNAEAVFAAGAGGDVAAIEPRTGRTIWRTRTRARLGGGTGAGEELVAVGSLDGEVIALEAADGKIRWRARVGGEILSAPAVAATAVVVRTVDGKLLALAAEDGRELWREEQSVPRLSLRGTARPVIAGDLVVCGFDNGKLLAVNLADGSTVWETSVAPARGRTELERLIDIDAQVQIREDDVFVVGFQGRAALLALDSGQVWWARDLSSFRGLDVDDEYVIVATADGDVVALQRRTGVEVWRQDALKRRGLSAPAIVGSYVAVADFQGYVHWLDKASGVPAARTQVGARVSNAPLVRDGTLIVIDDTGRLAAFRPRVSSAGAAPTPGR